jgi:hypothetical protein
MKLNFNKDLGGGTTMMKSEDLENEVKELQHTCEMLRAEKAKLWTENLKLKNGILNASESMQYLLQAILEKANETAVANAPIPIDTRLRHLRPRKDPGNCKSR